MNQPDPLTRVTYWADSQVDAHLAVLGQGSSHWGYSSNPNQVDSLPGSPRRNSTAALLQKIQGGAPTQVFLRERIQHLARDSRFTYVKEMFEDGASNLIELGVLVVLHWRLR